MERHHGRAKRVQLIADAIVRTGWATQAGYRGAPSEAPRITEDVAMVLVDSISPRGAVMQPAAVP